MNRVLSNSFLALLLSLFLLFSKSSNGQSCGCDHILKTNPDGGIYFTNGNGMTVLPGEKVCIQGGYYPYISLVGLVGTAAQPITIINCGGQVICGSGPSYCYRIVNSRYFKFTGTGTSGIFYGFKSYWAGGFTGAGMSVRDSSSDFEVDHLETMNCANGFLCKIDPADCSPATYSTGWLIKNISYHDNYVHNTIGEGMYLINTANTQDVLNCNNQTITIEPVKADNVKVYNNIIDSTGWDGIQLAASTNAEIYNNRVTNYGRTNMGSQQAGIILGAKSYGSIHDNYINGGTGEALEFYGYGGTTSIYNNTIINAGYDGTSAGQDGIAVDDRPAPNNQYTGMRVYIINNTVVNPARNAVHLYNSYGTMATGNKIYNNFLVKPNNKSIYDNPYTNIDGNTNVDTLNNVKTPVIANAYFVNANANNFRLLANSPAIDKGLNASSYGVTKDYDGVSRPQGSAFDAGAFEYNFGTPPPNQPPIADAGADKIITLPTNSVSLSGSGTDADGTISNYSWTKISGPSNGTIISTTSASTTVTSLVQGVYLFGLKVTDNQGATARDTVQVTVNVAANIPPVANAGADQTITLPTNTVSVIGSGTDADGTISSYLWTKVSGPSATITTATAATTSVTSLVQGSYLFELKVTDNQGATATDTMIVNVNAAGNIPPVADAGADKAITLPTNSVSVTGSGTDADGTISSYLWTKISGPSANITTATAATSSITSLVQGLYLFELKVTDNQGATATDTMIVNVNAAANIPPIADAGSDKIITLPTNSVSLSGSGTDADGTISNYSWAKISGPLNGTIINTTSASTLVISLVQGVYLFGLKVTDNQGATARDTVQVTVNVAANIPPVANAGADKTITLPTNSVSVTGSGTDADGTLSSYLWTKVSGPSANITTATAAITSITSLVQGSYLFELKVTDNQGATATDTVIVNVNAAGNIPPVANAGADKIITLPTNSVSLSGSGTDADGTINSYLWTKISGPSASITTATAATTSVTSLVQGSYLFELKVTDNKGATARDTITVNVNAAGNIPPVADAGADQTITLPTNSLSLSGSGTDADGTVSSYLWTKISGPSANITTATAATTSITSLVQGSYLFELKVTDNQGITATDTMIVNVNAAGNIPPVANAGTDKTITLPINSVSVTGSGTDADGTISNYLWTKISGPSTGSITSSSSVTTSITSLLQGSYLFELKVTDNQGATATDTMIINVNAAVNIPPVADAGADKTITLPTNSVSVTGSGTDADGTISNYLWTKISGPSTGSITSFSSATTSITSLVQGSYLFELKVTDNQGATASDTLVVNVNAAANIPPVANAGADKTIALPTDSVSVTGSGTDADGTISNYLWTKISGPSTGTITNSSSAITSFTSLVQGVYLFELKVTDNQGATASDTTKVIVNAAANIPPVADAGVDKTITLPLNVVLLAGSGGDADGSVINYSWSKISGPTSYNIVNPASPVTDVSGLAEGIYLFELIVTDNKGDIGNDTVKVIVKSNVNVPPIANAGGDQTITLPEDSTTLTGNGMDADGSIQGYYWRQISGPAISGISFPDAAVTNVSNLIGGTYQFELLVTDNSGAIAKDTLSVVVALPRLAIPNNRLKVYPNPVIDIATLEINTVKSNSPLLVVITDIQGKIVYKKELYGTQHFTVDKINVSNLTKGIYALTVYFNGTDKQTVKIFRSN